MVEKKKKKKMKKSLILIWKHQEKKLLYYSDAYLEPSRIFTMELFWEDSWRLKGVNHQPSNGMLYKPDLQKSGSLEKADPGPIKKADPMPKFIVLIRNNFMTN